MRFTILTTSFLLCFAGFGQQPSRDPHSPTAPANPSMTLGDPHEGGPGVAASKEKAAAYDKWTQAQKVSVAKAMGLDLGKLSARERAQVWAKMTVQEKADAYDYYFAQEDKARQQKQSPFR